MNSRRMHRSTACGIAIVNAEAPGPTREGTRAVPSTGARNIHRFCPTTKATVSIVPVGIGTDWFSVIGVSSRI
jgi:hypothetical protein